MEGSELRLGDDGVCFDPKTMRANSSLGLISMGERVRFVNGQLSVESQACEGTRIKVCVPIAGVDESLKHSAPRSGRFRQTAQRRHRTKVPYTAYAVWPKLDIITPTKAALCCPDPRHETKFIQCQLVAAYHSDGAFWRPCADTRDGRVARPGPG